MELSDSFEDDVETVVKEASSIRKWTARVPLSASTQRNADMLLLAQCKEIPPKQPPSTSTSTGTCIAGYWELTKLNSAGERQPSCIHTGRALFLCMESGRHLHSLGRRAVHSILCLELVRSRCAFYTIQPASLCMHCAPSSLYLSSFLRASASMSPIRGTSPADRKSAGGVETTLQTRYPLRCLLSRADIHRMELRLPPRQQEGPSLHT